MIKIAIQSDGKEGYWNNDIGWVKYVEDATLFNYDDIIEFPVGTNSHTVEICKCKYCDTDISWEGSDFIKGVIWECENCGELFCDACLLEKTGIQISDELDRILCPDCINTLKV